MDRKSTEKLRLDRRLFGRKNWIAPKDIEREIQALPDVSHKIAEVEEKSEPDPVPADSTEENPPVAESSIFAGSDPPQN